MLLEYQGEGRLLEIDVGALAAARKWRAYVASLHADVRDDHRRPSGRVPMTTLWYVDEGRVLGRVAIRHALTPWLTDVGGHIGYDVRPSARRRGHASAMLAQALPVARGLGIDPALVTCREQNVASRRVIERCGGVLDDVRQGHRRYWVATSAVDQSVSTRTDSTGGRSKAPSRQLSPPSADP
jgi:predicted acetyltransferase